jgi:hypothetical protein
MITVRERHVADEPSAQHTGMTREMSDKLRQQFPPGQVGKLPRGGITLDYVGHADVTSRLIEADPEWNWEPAALDENGLPRFDLADNGKPVGLWIRLTVGGVSRLGYGSVPASQNDAVKVLIGDALRNAAMRFGVAVDLWAKGDRLDPTQENPAGSAGHAVRGAHRPAQGKPRPEPVTASSPEELAAQIAAAGTAGQLNEIWKAAGRSGSLNKSHGDKTVMQLLQDRNEELVHSKSTEAAGEGAGSADGDQQ